ncbi:hypothetical protein [Acetivibrio straminisolvens]|uniref:hypothetical protein n=1 Tax=Acetivibrio straminisolvens TaxID=253314 RepID=UPI00223F12BA|nr:hypothetical protein [Acetivibrio straminisolvens]
MKEEMKLASSLHPSAKRIKAWRNGYIKALWNKWEGARLCREGNRLCRKRP